LRVIIKQNILFIVDYKVVVGKADDDSDRFLLRLRNRL
jgi:hypothetical protein